MTPPTYHAYPFDAAFSEAVILDGLIYLSGHIGDDDDGHLAQGFDAEVHQMMTNVTASLARFDRTVTSLVSVKVILTDMEQRERFETLFGGYFDGEPLPARTILARRHWRWKPPSKSSASLSFKCHLTGDQPFRTRGDGHRARATALQRHDRLR